MPVYQGCTEAVPRLYRGMQEDRISGRDWFSTPDTCYTYRGTLRTRSSGNCYAKGGEWLRPTEATVNRDRFQPRVKQGKHGPWLNADVRSRVLTRNSRENRRVCETSLSKSIPRIFARHGKVIFRVSVKYLSPYRRNVAACSYCELQPY